MRARRRLFLPSSISQAAALLVSRPGEFRQPETALLLSPLAIIGAYRGYRLTLILPEKIFFRIVEVALFLVSLKLVYDGVVGLTNG